MPRPTAYAYIDGFNLYYGCLKKTRYKWLNISLLLRKYLAGKDLICIRYFTAKVIPPPWDLSQSVRQETYLRALKTIPGLSIHEGHFRSHVVTRALATSPPNSPQYVEVIDTKEKGSDVNLATFALADGFMGLYDCAVIVSNDVDLKEPIKTIRKQCKKDVIVLHPYQNTNLVELQKEASQYIPIRQQVIASCLFPPMLNDAKGIINKPTEW
jgi:uncharacterized LabA/DUF88 family protein